MLQRLLVAATAQQRFENGTDEDKKTILQAIGSYLTLKDKKLTIQARTPFVMIKEALVDGSVVDDWLVPNKKLDNRENKKTLHPQNINCEPTARCLELLISQLNPTLLQT